MISENYLRKTLPPAALKAVEIAAIENWLISHISTLMRIPAEEIDVSMPFTYYGLGSVELVTLAGELEEYLGHTISPTVAWDYPTIASTARYLANWAGTQPQTEVAANVRSDAFNLENFLSGIQTHSNDEVTEFLSN